MDEHLTGRALHGRLPPDAAGWIRSIEVHDVVTSTNDALKEQARRGAPEGTVVLATRQTAGRGRMGRTWESPSGSLYLSVLLRPQGVAPSRLGLLPLAAGVAVAEGLGDLGLEVQLKWPNDVWVQERKVAGLLAEAASGPAGVENIVLGIGINVAGSLDGLSEEVRPTATSLLQEGVTADVPGVALAVLTRLAHWCPAWARATDDVVAAWRYRALPWWGRTVEVRSGGTVIVGIAREIDPMGALVLETPEGSVAVVAGEARALRPRHP